MIALSGQVIRLLKSTLLRTDDRSGPFSSFMPGKHSNFGIPYGIAVTWWHGADAFSALESVASLLSKSKSAFRDCDRKTVLDIVSRTLQEICVNKDLFNTDDVVFARQDTLFDCIRIPAPECASKIISAMAENLTASIGRRCTLYAVPRLRPNSFALPDSGLHIVLKDDRLAWARLIEDGFLFSGWTPERPAFDRESAPFLIGKFECVLVADGCGTNNGTRSDGVLKFRALLATIFAIASERAEHRFFKSVARPLELCIQFPHATSPDKRILRNDCGALFPYYAEDIVFDSADVSEITEWYERSARCPPEAKNRIEKAAHFLNLGMNADHTDAYVNFFVALDALLGQRGSVETSILDGLDELDFSAKQIEKARWLFDLRNELVHGGSRYIEEWPKYARYTRHFRTSPMEDVQQIAQQCILRAPRTWAS